MVDPTLPSSPSASPEHVDPVASLPEWEEGEATLSAQTPAFTRAPDFAVRFDDLRAAADRLKADIMRTPIIENPFLNAMVGGRVLLKLETLQLGGSFKVRGAFNRLLQLTDEQRRTGVVAWSSGNHALAIALAARRVGTRATIVMPHDAPAVKIFATRAQGAEVVFYHRVTEDREAMAHAIAKERGALIVPSFDDPHIIAGQGTCGLELAEQATSLGLSIDTVLVNCSGGGLASGTAIALKHYMPQCALYTVEPEGYDDMARSLRTGGVEEADKRHESVCDALLSPGRAS